MWREEYKRLMLSYDITGKDLREAHELKCYNIPKSLFKYQGINDYTLDHLRKDTAFFRIATEFNDPYDSVLAIQKEELLDEKLKKDLLKLFSEEFNVDSKEIKKIELNIGNLTFEEILQELSYHCPLLDNNLKETKMMISRILREKDTQYENFASDVADIYQKRVFVSCFSKKATSMLMWSHYAAHHSGICVEYDFSNLDNINDIILNLYPVHYVQNLLNLSNEPQKKNPFHIILASSSKSEEWIYEEEWRIIFQDSSIKESFSRVIGKPKSIILGSRATEENKTKVIEIASSRGIPLKQMKLDRRNYGLLIVDFYS